MDALKSGPASNSAGSKQQPKSNGKSVGGTRASMNGGTDKALPKLPPQAQAKSSAGSQVDKHAHDRLLYIIAHFTGQDATLTLKNGEQFTGVFSGGSFDSVAKTQYVLKMAKRTRLPSHQQVNGTVEMPDEYTGDGEDHVMTFDVQDTVDLAVTDVTTSSAQPAQNGSISSSFRTDTEISQRDAPVARQRELQRWDAGADSSIDMSLEASGETGWDQFAANERMYGVQSSYDESYYTTAIDRSNPQYRQREAEAARIAREIEGTTAANPHVAEERRRDADKEDGLDEEDKYSGVRREGTTLLPKRGAGSYVPPSQRPITGTPTVPGAPFDPAIISTSKPVPSAPAAPVAVPENGAEQAAAALTIQQPQLQPATAGDAPRETSVPTSVSSQASKKPTEQTAEDHMRKAADAFKEFANIEKLKARAAQEQKKSHIRQEKSVKLNDLKKFAMNFKLNTRVPDDLVPILAKDRDKQTEIQNKAEEAAKEAEVKAEQKKKEKTTSAAATPPAPAPVPASNATASQPPPASDPRLPYNPQSRARASQQMRGAPISGSGQQGQSPRGPLSQRPQQGFSARGGMQAPPPLPPADLRIPTGPAAASVAERVPLSPASSIGLNVNARSFEFRPVASAFTPSGTSPSPQRVVIGMETPAASEATASFFGKDKKPSAKDRKDVESSFNPIKRMIGEELPEEHKKSLAGNGGVPQPYRTPPTWNVVGDNSNVSYKDSFPKNRVPSQGPSPLHTPNPNGTMPHAHQLPVHLQAPQISTPQQRPPYYAQQHHGQAPSFDPRMQQFGPGGSVQSSPRFPPANLAFNGQMQHMQMPQFAGQPMPAYGMSPSMGYRQPQVMQGGPMMMPAHQQGQMPQMRQGFPQGPQFAGPPMGGQMMVPNPSGGGYMNGPMPQQQPYSPMPPHAQPQMPHMQGGPHNGPAGYTSSPRPPMMQQQGSHQGFQPQMHGHGPPQFAPSPGQPHPYHYQQRQMSTGQGYPQMTPRQQQAMPQHPSPGMGALGDEGK
ncbi:hypothetical protein LTR36_004986 [Oleoguttula mirabilis]|uniref:LsmAD domain-containing protein n=1 Tax=Oleoguttula mirabilis TaxID=1507867 RepID=A0AAV9JYG8_9PEZI|nr:hypothetical protein LTR36_004986 [Oleoguttula mirabilis]